MKTKINLKHFSEFDVQAAAYYRLMHKFKHVKGEVKIENPGGRGAKLDLVVCDDDGNIVIAFELKKRHYAKRDSKQVRRYREMFDFPVVTIFGWNDAKNVVDIALRHLVPVSYKLLRHREFRWP